MKFFLRYNEKFLVKKFSSRERGCNFEMSNETNPIAGGVSGKTTSSQHKPEKTRFTINIGDHNYGKQGI